MRSPAIYGQLSSKIIGNNDILSFTLILKTIYFEANHNGVKESYLLLNVILESEDVYLPS